MCGQSLVHLGIITHRIVLPIFSTLSSGKYDTFVKYQVKYLKACTNHAHIISWICSYQGRVVQLLFIVLFLIILSYSFLPVAVSNLPSCTSLSTLESRSSVLVTRPVLSSEESEHFAATPGSDATSKHAISTPLKKRSLSTGVSQKEEKVHKKVLLFNRVFHQQF